MNKDKGIAQNNIRLREEKSPGHRYDLWKTVVKWGPYLNIQSDDFRLAWNEAHEMQKKLEKLWPCTFLVKGYPYDALLDNSTIQETQATPEGSQVG